MDEKSLSNFIEFLKEDDLDFYERCLADLTDEQFERFIKENPDFFSDLSNH